jgi:hypothetical protein
MRETLTNKKTRHNAFLFWDIFSKIYANTVTLITEIRFEAAFSMENTNLPNLFNNYRFRFKTIVVKRT